jgi:hypothetical protein
MTISSLLIILFNYSLCLDNSLVIEDEVREALIMSYQLRNGETTSIIRNLQSKGFELYEDTKLNEQLFFKYLDDEQREIYSISIHEGKAISISHYHLDNGSNFADSVRSEFIKSDYFRKINNDEFSFSLDSNNSEFQSKILFNDVVIIFMIPSTSIEQENWSKIIRELKF